MCAHVLSSLSLACVQTSSLVVESASIRHCGSLSPLFRGLAASTASLTLSVMVTVLEAMLAGFEAGQGVRKIIHAGCFGCLMTVVEGKRVRVRSRAAVLIDFDYLFSSFFCFSSSVK